MIGLKRSGMAAQSQQQEIKRRSQKVRVFPNEASLTRLVSRRLGRDR